MPYHLPWLLSVRLNGTVILLLSFNPNWILFMIIKCPLPKARDGKVLQSVPRGFGSKRLGNLYF